MVSSNKNVQRIFLMHALIGLFLTNLQHDEVVKPAHLQFAYKVVCLNSGIHNQRVQCLILGKLVQTTFFKPFAGFFPLLCGNGHRGLAHIGSTWHVLPGTFWGLFRCSQISWTDTPLLWIHTFPSGSATTTNKFTKDYSNTFYMKNVSLHTFNNKSSHDW